MLTGDARNDHELASKAHQADFHQLCRPLIYQLENFKLCEAEVLQWQASLRSARVKKPCRMPLATCGFWLTAWAFSEKVRSSDVGS